MMIDIMVLILVLIVIARLAGTAIAIVAVLAGARRSCNTCQ